MRCYVDSTLPLNIKVRIIFKPLWSRLDKTPMTKCHRPKTIYKKCSPQPQTQTSVAYLLHWRFVRGIETGYCSGSGIV